MKFSAARRRRGATTALLAGLLFVMPVAPAFAHGGGDSDQSRVLVVDALAYLANTPEGYEDHVSDKIGDALEAPDTSGVDLAKVTEAQQAFEDGDLVKARTLLQAAILPATDAVTGDETGTSTMLDPYHGQTNWQALELLLLTVCLVSIVAGIALAYRWRPAESVADIRKTLAVGGTR